MIIAIIVAIILALSSLFCFISKKLDKSKQYNQISSNVSGMSVIKRQILNTYSFINDYIFLLFKIVGYIPSHHVRMLFYKYIFHMKIGRKTIIYYGLEARKPWNIIIGEGCSIGDRAIMDARRPIVIDDNVNISSGVWIWTVQHDVNSESFGTVGKEKPVQIGKYAWVSSRTTILPGADVLEGDVIAAGAVLTKACKEQYCIYGGVPAKKIGDRNRNLHYQLARKYRHFL